MKKLIVIQYLACITFILILFSILPGEALATKPSSENEHGSQYADENTISAENYEKDSSKDANDTESSSSESVKEENGIQNENKYSTYKLERKQIQEDLQLQKSEYREAKNDFIRIKDEIQAGKLNFNSKEATEATKLYLNSSISYMIAHLRNVRTNMQYSKGNGIEERISAIDEHIKLLESEQAAIANASSQKELLATVRSVHDIWTSAQKNSLTGAGQTVSQKIGEFLDKSGDLSKKLEVEVEGLNETGTDTSSLKTRLASYKLYLEAAREKKEAADSIYENDNATRENLEVANNYLRESLNNINKANQILRVIFDELKESGFKGASEIGTEDSIKIEFNNNTGTN